MLVSPCSLRSAQCAALIALAAAAGIGRVEKESVAASPSRTAAASQPMDVHTTWVARQIQIARNALAPWLQFFTGTIILEASKPPGSKGADGGAAMQSGAIT